jgi:hypothetical protein
MVLAVDVYSSFRILALSTQHLCIRPYFEHEGVPMNTLFPLRHGPISAVLVDLLRWLKRLLFSVLRYRIARPLIRRGMIPGLFKLYELLLMLYPGRFRRRYYRAMLRDFIAVCMDQYYRAGHQALIRIAVREICDVIHTSVSVGIEEIRRPPSYSDNEIESSRGCDLSLRGRVARMIGVKLRFHDLRRFFQVVVIALTVIFVLPQVLRLLL